MKNKYGLICMGFDGEFKNESREGFETVQKAWEYSDDMGSRWYFYPFRFVTSTSGKSIVDSGYGLKFFNGKRVKTVQAFFKRVSELPEAINADCDLFAILLRDNQYNL